MNKPPLYNTFDESDEAVIQSLDALTKSTSDSEGMSKSVMGNLKFSFEKRRAIYRRDYFQSDVLVLDVSPLSSF